MSRSWLTFIPQDLACKVLHDVKIAMTDLNSSADHSKLLQEDHDRLRAALAGFTKTTIFAINRLYHGTLDRQDRSGGITAAIQTGPSEAVYLIYLSARFFTLASPLLNICAQLHFHSGRICPRRNTAGGSHVRGRFIGSATPPLLIV